MQSEGQFSGKTVDDILTFDTFEDIYNGINYGPTEKFTLQLGNLNYPSSNGPLITGVTVNAPTEFNNISSTGLPCGYLVYYDTRPTSLEPTGTNNAITFFNKIEEHAANNYYAWTDYNNLYLVYEDSDGDGDVTSLKLKKVDENRDALQGITFTLKKNKLLLSKQETDSNGLVTFPITKTGNYTLEETLPDGSELKQMDPVYFTVGANAGGTPIEISDTADITFDDSTKTNIIVNHPLTTPPELMSISGTKTWIDNNNQAQSRPSNIKIRLFKSVNSASPIELTEKTPKWDKTSNPWEYEFTDLPKTEGGLPITYSVTEDAVSNYATEQNGYNFTNTYTPPSPTTPTPASINLQAKKAITGSSISPAGYEFAVYEVPDTTTPVATGTSIANGDITFTAIEYTTAGAHTYTIKETTTLGSGWAVSPAAGHTVTVTATDNNGQLIATPSYGTTPPAFTNTYTPPEEPETTPPAIDEPDPTPPAISVEVDKDTIKRTSAAYESLPGKEGFKNTGSADERYKYDIDFRSTSNVPADEFVVDDPLEAVSRKQIRVDELWTPIVWGDADNEFYVLYKTNKTGTGTGTDAGSPSIDSNPQKPASEKQYKNDGYKLWPENSASAAAAASGPTGANNTGALSADARHHMNVSDLGLAPDEYVTAIRFDYGAVNVGFTSKNYSDRSLNGEHRDASGAVALPENNAPNIAPLKSSALRIAEDGSINLRAFASGITTDGYVDWTPKQSDAYYSEALVKENPTLKPASYLVSASRAMQAEDIVSSVSARIALGKTTDLDQDAVITKEIETFTASPTEFDVASQVEKDSFVTNAQSSGITLKGGKALDKDGKAVKTIDPDTKKASEAETGLMDTPVTGDEMVLGLLLLGLSASAICIITMISMLIRSRRKQSYEKGGAK
jgi:pilin isopeptide linkage protein